jgi:hypothetical protein
MYLYDQIALAVLVPRRRWEAIALGAAGLLGAGMGVRTVFAREAWTAAGGSEALAPWVLAFVYAPALLLVLTRPNEGGLPAWIERGRLAWSARLRRWGRSA